MLKRFASILLLFILLFNFIGYRFLSDYLEKRADVQLESQIDNNHYSDAQLVSIKIPVRLAYYNNSSRFERINGQFEFNGIKYKYVKRRIFNDSVEILCIPNQDAMTIQSAKDEFFKLVNDLQQTGPAKKSGNHNHTKISLTDNYTFHEIQYLLPFASPVLAINAMHGAGTSSCFIASEEQPPDNC